jgi:23S rRNA (uridine2552-2'-O)-methyltransferase
VPVYQRKDRFHQRAKREGFRSRAAYKLTEIQASHRLLRPGQRVADLGCWPGGWLEGAAKFVGPKGRVVGVDRAEVDPPILLANVTALVGDLEDADMAARLTAALGNAGRVESQGAGAREDVARLADVVLSDAAPKLTGVRETDRANEERLLEAIEALLPKLLVRGGSFVIKILEGPEAQEIDRRIRKTFQKAKTVKLQSTRKGSTEKYLVARGYLGDATIANMDNPDSREIR